MSSHLNAAGRDIYWTMPCPHQVHCATRPSLPDLTPAVPLGASDGPAAFTFNSQDDSSLGRAVQSLPSHFLSVNQSGTPLSLITCEALGMEEGCLAESMHLCQGDNLSVWPGVHHPVSECIINAAADALRCKLDSALFGFDVLVETNTGKGLPPYAGRKAAWGHVTTICCEEHGHGFVQACTTLWTLITFRHTRTLQKQGSGFGRCAQS